MTSAAENMHGTGIEALNVYCGIASIPVRSIFEGRSLDVGRIGNLMMEQRSIGLPCEDPVTNAVNAAMPVIERLNPEEKAAIEILIISSESGVDYSKSIASYVHEHLGLSRECRLIEAKQACYAATAAVQMAVAYVASGISQGAKVLVVATDVSLADDRVGYAEPAMGTGGAAILVSAQPSIMSVDFGAFGSYSYETLDSARPGPAFDIVDTDKSLFAYLDCLSRSFENYARRVEGADFVATFDYLAFHTPFGGLVKAAHRKMMRECAKASAEQVEEDFVRRVKPSLIYPCIVGNLCSGSVYLALSSLIDTAPLNGGSRVGVFSYGSGCSSEFFSGLIHHSSASVLAEMRIAAHLGDRCVLTFEQYTQLLADNLRCLVPEKNRRIDLASSDKILARARARRMLVLREIRDYHREYDWV